MRNGLYVDTDGNHYWYVNDQLHRTDGPAIEWPNGSRWWYKNNQLHREDGPAVERRDGNRWWCRNDHIHRDDGPAVEWANGERDWYWHGRYCSLQEWLEFNNKLTPQQKTVLMLKYADE